MTKVAVPTTAAELEEMLNDTSKVRAIYEQGDLGEFIKNYVVASNKKDPDIKNQIREVTTQVMAEWLKENEAEHLKKLNLAPYGRKSHLEERAAAYNPEAAGAAVDKLFKNSGDYFFSISNKALRTPDREQKIDALRNALGSNIPADGGFLIPERLRSELLRVSLESAIVRPRARVIPMDSLRVPFPAIDSTSNASSVYGGITAYWAEEGATLTETNPKFKRVVLEAKKLTIYTEIPSELMQDSIISMKAFIDSVFPEALAWFEDVSFTEGGGVGEPLGFLNSPAAVSVTRAGANNIAWADVAGMYARMLPQSLSRAVWIAHISTFPELATMEIAAGSPATWINHQLADGPPMTLLGRPVIFTEKVEALGSAGDLNFVDFGMYLIGDRQAMQARESEHFRFNTDEVAFRITERVDGRPWLTNAITPRNGTDTLSPFVKIAA